MRKLLLFGILLIGNIRLFAPGLSLQAKFEKWQYITSVYNEMIYEKELSLYAYHLGYVESRNDWRVVNKHGYMGTWQHGTRLLKEFGLNITPEKFRADSSAFPPDVQYRVLMSQIRVQTIRLKKYDSWIGQEIGGITITRSGMLAGAHLGGIGAVKAFLYSNGTIDRADANETKISDYLKEFSIYKL